MKIEAWSASTREKALSDQWRAAYERDAQSGMDYADPRPERRAAVACGRRWEIRERETGR